MNYVRNKMGEPKDRPFKVWDKERLVKKGIIVSSLEELKTKGCEKLNIVPPVRVVLEEDGTEIDDEEYFSFLPDNCTLMLLPGQSEWMPPHSHVKTHDHPDGAVDNCIVLECGSAESDLSLVIEKIKGDLFNVVFLNEAEMQQLVDADTEGLAQILGKSTKVIQSLQESCQRQIDEQTDVKNALGLVRYYDEKMSALRENSETKKRKLDN